MLLSTMARRNCSAMSIFFHGFSRVSHLTLQDAIDGYKTLIDPRYQKRLISLTSQLDQWLAEADQMLIEPADAEIACNAEELRELRELLVTMQAKIEAEVRAVKGRSGTDCALWPEPLPP